MRMILLIDLVIEIRSEKAGSSMNLGFLGSIQTLQCAIAQAMMLSLEFQFQFPTWAEFEDCQLSSPLAYKDTKYLI